MKTLLRTLGQRTGWDLHLRPFLFKQLPSETGWSGLLGSLCALTFALMAATGVVLCMYYNPSPDKAYASIDYIMESVPGGSLIRGLHHWGAGAMVLLVFLHLLTSFFSGTYKAPREITWITGVALLLATLGLGFTGYLLPWDQKAFWATIVGAQLPSDIPLVGKWLTRLILGGPTVSGFTLTRFYAAHMLILPTAIVLLATLHIYLVRLHGMAELPPTDHEPDSVYCFYPEHLARSAAVFALLVLLLVLLSHQVGVPGEAVAGTIDERYAPRPEWYFMWLFQLLTFFPGSTEVIGSLIIPGLLVLLLFALPWVDSRRPLTPASERPLALAVGITAVTGLVYLTAMGVGASGDFGLSIVLPDRPPSPQEQAGMQVFIREECASCHHIAGRGGRRVGPDLANMTAKGRTAEHLVRYIRKPDEVDRFARMPAFALGAQDLQDLAAFIRSLDFSQVPMKVTPLTRMTQDKE